MKKQIICSILVATFAFSPISSYAEPRGIWRFFGREIANKVNKETIKARKEIEKEIMDNHRKDEYTKTIEIYNKKSKEMTKEQTHALRHILDHLTKKKGKIFEDLETQKKSLKYRLKNKKIIWEDHRAIRNYLNGLPNLKGKSDKELKEFARKWLNYFKNPYSDINTNPNTAIFIPIPSSIPLSNPIPTLAY